MIKLGIIVGHDEVSKGAYSAQLKMHEYDFWSDFALDLWRECREMGIDAQVFKRDGLSIIKVAQTAGDWADAVIELHFNSFEDPKVSGCETLFIEGSKLFAQTIHNGVIKALTEPNPKWVEHRKDVGQPFIRPKDRGLKELKKGERGFPSLDSIKKPACLIEPFFGSSPEDVKRFLKHRMQVVRGLVSSLIMFKLLDK